MKFIKYQVRWDWVSSETGERTQHASHWIVGVSVSAGWKAAQLLRNGLLLQEDYWFDHGVEFDNLRIVRVTEEVVV